MTSCPAWSGRCRAAAPTLPRAPVTSIRVVVAALGRAGAAASIGRSQRREIAVSGTVEAAPRLSQRTLAVPALGSTAWTTPISPVAFLRT